MRFIARILLFSACAWLAACSTQEVYTGESFAADSPFKMRVDSDVAPACESARRSLLGWGYLIESSSEEGIKARKATRGGETQNTFIEMNIVCLPDAKGTVLFATGVLTTYDLKKSSSSASVGVSAFGSISLPIGQSADSLVKVSEQTIDDKEFYGRFFMAVSNTLDEMNAGKAPPEATVEPAAPEAAPVQPAAPAPPVQVAQPGSALPATATPGVAASNAAEPAPVQPAAAPVPTAVTPDVTTTPAPVTSPATVAPENAATPEVPALLPEPALSEQVPTYTLQPDAAPAAPASPPATAGTEQPAVPAAEPAPNEQPVATEAAPATENTIEEAQPVTGSVAPAPAPTPQPAPDASGAAESEPVVDNNLLFL